MKVRVAIALALLVVVAASVAFAVCPYQATCPMHSVQSNATGQTKRTDGGQREWAEYHCPGLGTESPHNFWVECK
jgi:hypothetical protein